MKVTVTGATGTLGREVVAELKHRGDQVTVLSRDAGPRAADAGRRRPALEWADPKTQAPPAEAFAGQDAVVHLLGEPIAQRWSDDIKREIRDSRVLSTRNLVAVLRDLDPAERPAVLVSQSAVGWYGARGDEQVDESEPAADDFLAQVCVDWEAEAHGAERPGPARGVHAHRRGAVRGRRRAGEDAAPVQARAWAARWPAASSTCPGCTPTTWWARCCTAWTRARCAGPVNVTAPEPVTNAELSKALGRVLGRPAIAPGARLRGEAALRRDGHHRDHRRAGRARRAGAVGLRVPPGRPGQRAAGRDRPVLTWSRRGGGTGGALAPAAADAGRSSSMPSSTSDQDGEEHRS